MRIDVDNIWDYIIAIILASSGGFARMLNKRGGRKLTVVKVLSELFISGFAGIMVLLLARSLGLTGDWLGLVAGMAGWIGPQLLDLLEKPVKKAIGLNTED